MFPVRIFATKRLVSSAFLRNVNSKHLYTPFASALHTSRSLPLNSQSTSPLPHSVLPFHSLTKLPANTRAISLYTPNHLDHEGVHEWKIVRLGSWVLTILLPSALAGQFLAYGLDRSAWDMSFAVSALISLQLYWAIDEVLADYLRVRLFGPYIPRLARTAWLLLSAGAFFGLCLFNWDDVGVLRGFGKLLTFH